MKGLFARWLIIIGVCLTALGIFVNFLLEQNRVHVTPTEFSILGHTFPRMITVGLLATLAGSVAWAWRRTSVSSLASSGVVIAVLALLAAELLPINFHGWTGWLMFVCLDALLIAVLFIVFAAVRFTSSRLALRRR
jgi:hypothetical protein